MAHRRLLLIACVMQVALSTAVSGTEPEGASLPAEPPTPVALIGARCVFCHGPAVMLGFSRNLLFEGGPEALDAFLARHHAPDKDAREAIVRFLVKPTAPAN